MDFANKELRKYGWSEGKGLGKNEDGITSAIKPKLKFDNSGIGHKEGDQYSNNWWEKLFDNASENIQVETDHEEVKVKLTSGQSVEITNKTYSFDKLKKENNLEYGTFLKTERVTCSAIETYRVSTAMLDEPSTSFAALTDDQLFAACGGRTAHKGARHGLKLSGKLARLEKQEKMLLKKMMNFSLSDEAKEKKLEKLKMHKKKKAKKKPSIVNFLLDEPDDPVLSPHKKKSNKKRVSFNESLTEYYTPDLDTSFESEESCRKDENCNEPPIVPVDPVGSDEGIDLGLDEDNNNGYDDDYHRSFVQARLNISDLSKAERKKLKKKRKLELKRYTATLQFLNDCRGDDDENTMDIDNNPKKRKLNFGDKDCSESKRALCKNDKKKSKKKKKKDLKKKRKEEKKKLNSIVKGLDNLCRISDDDI